MPTYDYKCNACGHRFEEFQSIKDAPKRKCPKCGKNALERLIGTGAAVLFKGSGFYQTDYRSDSYKKAAEAESKPAAKADSGDSASNDREHRPMLGACRPSGSPRTPSPRSPSCSRGRSSCGAPRRPSPAL